MSILKIADNPCDTDEALSNLCAYIVDYEKTENYVGGRGLKPSTAYEEMSKLQALWNKTTGRKAYHLILSFGSCEPLTKTDVFEIAYEVSSIFFPQYQVLYGEHINQENLHIHFAVGTVNIYNGAKLHIDFSMKNKLEAEIDKIVKNYI